MHADPGKCQRAGGRDGSPAAGRGGGSGSEPSSTPETGPCYAHLPKAPPGSLVYLPAWPQPLPPMPDLGWEKPGNSASSQGCEGQGTRLPGHAGGTGGVQLKPTEGGCGSHVSNGSTCSMGSPPQLRSPGGPRPTAPQPWGSRPCCSVALMTLGTNSQHQRLQGRHSISTPRPRSQLTYRAKLRRERHTMWFCTQALLGVFAQATCLGSQASGPGSNTGSLTPRPQVTRSS